MCVTCLSHACPQICLAKDVACEYAGLLNTVQQLASHALEHSARQQQLQRDAHTQKTHALTVNRGTCSGTSHSLEHSIRQQLLQCDAVDHAGDGHAQVNSWVEGVELDVPARHGQRYTCM